MLSIVVNTLFLGFWQARFSPWRKDFWADSLHGHSKRLCASPTMARPKRCCHSPKRSAESPNGNTASVVKDQYTSTSTAASCANFTTSENFSSFVFGALSLASTPGADSRKLNSRLLLTA